MLYAVTQILSLLPNSITYGSDTSDRKLGNGERGQPWKGRINIWPWFGRVGYTSRKDRKESSGGPLDCLTWHLTPPPKEIIETHSGCNPGHLILVAKTRWKLEGNSTLQDKQSDADFIVCKVHVLTRSQHFSSRHFQTLTITDEVSSLLTLSSSSSSLPWKLMIKLPTLGGNGIWNLRFFRLDWKFQRSCWEKEEDGGLGVGKMSVSPS